MQLNDNQKYAVNYTNGPLLILAGPGAGKTKTLTERIVHLIKDKNVSPANILMLTFTKKAAEEMRERAIDKLKVSNVNIFTFHSFSIRVLRENFELVGLQKDFKIISSKGDELKILKFIIKTYHKDIILSNLSEILESISLKKETNEFKEVCISDIDLKSIYKEYNDFLLKNNLVTFSDIVFFANKILDNDMVLSRVQEKYKYIMIDEYQDTNKIQYEIVNKIASKYRNLCVVGDENQSIYGFRGASIKNILNFKNDYPEAEICTLNINYRSTNNIVNASNSLISNNKSSLTKNITSNREEGKKVFLKSFETSEDQNQYILYYIISKQIKKDFDIAILYRNNQESRKISELLSANNIPYTIKGVKQFYDNDEIEFLLNFLQLLLNKNDLYLFSKVINYTQTVITEQEYNNLKNNNFSIKDILFLSLLKKEKLEKIRNLMNLLNKCDNFQFIIDKLNIFIEEIKLFEYLKKNSLDSSEKVMNVNEFLESMQIEKNISNVLVKISHIKNMNTDNENAVKLMTLHSSKGLEFKNVLIINCNDGILPSYNPKGDTDIEEERRLLYVGMTRAKDELIITFSNKITFNSFEIKSKKSQFLDEIDNAFLESNSKNHLYPGRKKRELNNEENAFNINDKVVSKLYGDGIITNINEDYTSIKYGNENVCYETCSLQKYITS